MRSDRTTARTERLSADASGIARAAELLRGGGTVALPTETVYGLGANALDSAAVARIFEAKERPSWDPLIVHVSGRAMLERVAVLAGDAGERAERLVDAFWPGPLTLLLPRTATVPDVVTSGRALVGVRMPAHAVALEVIGAAGVPVAAPSANRFGRTSPTTAAHVLEDLDGRIDAVLDGGPTSVGVESTVLDVGAWPMVIYRPGAVTMEMIERVAGEVRRFAAPEESAVPESLPSPGVGLRHYAPRARLMLVEDEVEMRGVVATLGAAERVGVMLPFGWSVGGSVEVFRWADWVDANGLAQRVFAGLRELDGRSVQVIVCPVPQMGGVGEALRDRLQKAARQS